MWQLPAELEPEQFKDYVIMSLDSLSASQLWKQQQENVV